MTSRSAGPRPILAVSQSGGRPGDRSRRTCFLNLSRKGGSLQTPPLVAFLSLVLLAATACHSYHIDTTIENRSGAPIQLIEVDYPEASFGVDSLANGAIFHYRFQVRGSGPLKLSYTATDGKQVHITGPTLAERQQGQLEIVLLPGGKADFLPRLTPQP
jgi:hypothetical protein